MKQDWKQRLGFDPVKVVQACAEKGIVRFTEGLPLAVHHNARTGRPIKKTEITEEVFQALQKAERLFDAIVPTIPAQRRKYVTSFKDVLAILRGVKLTGREVTEWFELHGFSFKIGAVEQQLAKTRRA